MHFFSDQRKLMLHRRIFLKKNFADDTLRDFIISILKIVWRDFFAMGGMFQMYRSHTIQRLLSTKGKLFAFNSNL